MYFYVCLINSKFKKYSITYASTLEAVGRNIENHKCWLNELKYKFLFSAAQQQRRLGDGLGALQLSVSDRLATDYSYLFWNSNPSHQHPAP